MQAGSNELASRSTCIDVLQFAVADVKKEVARVFKLASKEQLVLNAHVPLGGANSNAGRLGVSPGYDKPAPVATAAAAASTDSAGDSKSDGSSGGSGNKKAGSRSSSPARTAGSSGAPGGPETKDSADKADKADAKTELAPKLTTEIVCNLKACSSRTWHREQRLSVCAGRYDDCWQWSEG